MTEPMDIEVLIKWAECHRDVNVSIDRTGEESIYKDKYTIIMKTPLGARIDYILDEKELDGLTGILDNLYRDIQKADKIGKILTEIMK